MTTSRLALLTISFLFTFADPPVYPGAKRDAAYTQMAKDEGITHGSFYLTADSFEKVKAFYAKAGKVLPQHAPAPAGAKLAAFVFPHDMGVLVAWPAGSDHQTSIAICEVDPATIQCRDKQ